MFRSLALVFGIKNDKAAWIPEDSLLAHAGGGSAGYRAVGEALEKLREAGLVERRTIAGRGLFRRSELGEIAAHELIREGSFHFPPSVLEAESISFWNPEPGSPKALDELVGQESARYMIRRNLDWASSKACNPLNMLLYGAAGSGKTMIAGIVSRELSLPFFPLSMAEITYPELVEILELAKDGAVLFFDEMQAAPKRVKDALLVHLDPSRDSTFVAIGATTDPGALSQPLRRRFQVEVPLVEYSIAEAEQLAEARAKAIGLKLDAGTLYSIARAARSNPAKVARLIAEAEMIEVVEGQVSNESFIRHLQQTGRDVRGVDANEVEILIFLRDEAMGPAGMSKLSEALGLDSRFVGEKLRNLRREGLVQNFGRAGHAISAAGRKYLMEMNNN